MMKMNDMSKTPLTDEIIKYCDYQFPATQGHIPLRTMIEKIEKENAELKELLSEIQDWMMENDYEYFTIISEKISNAK